MTTHRRRSLLVSVLIAAAALVPLAAMDAAEFDGKPTFKGGEGYGYYVWREGDTWKVRWTTFGAKHRFSGLVQTEGGELAKVKAIDVDEERRVLAPGRAPHVVYGPRGRPHLRGGRAPVVAERQQDHINRDDARTIRFATITDDDLDGFDFEVKPGVERVRFLLQIDGRSRPGDVAVGRQGAHPAESPFVAILR
jgi:hypothetical protein